MGPEVCHNIKVLWPHCHALVFDFAEDPTKWVFVSVGVTSCLWADLCGLMVARVGFPPSPTLKTPNVMFQQLCSRFILFPWPNLSVRHHPLVLSAKAHNSLHHVIDLHVFSNKFNHFEDKHMLESKNICISFVWMFAYVYKAIAVEYKPISVCILRFWTDQGLRNYDALYSDITLTCGLIPFAT